MVGVKDWVVKYFIWLIENLDSENLGSDLERWRRKIMVRNIGIRKKKDRTHSRFLLYLTAKPCQMLSSGLRLLPSA